VKHRVDVILNRADGSDRNEAQVVIDKAVELLRPMIESGELRVRQAVHQDSIKPRLLSHEEK
jgi:hypothetical protein